MKYIANENNSNLNLLHTIDRRPHRYARETGQYTPTLRRMDDFV